MIAVAIAIVAVPFFYPSLAPTDAYVYFAAGQRLNAGHELYRLMPGDLVIASNPPYWNVPILSPPLVGVIWRPLAALGWAGLLLGWALTGVAYLVAVALLTFRTGAIGVAATLALAAPIGIQLGLGNVNGLIALGLILAWLCRDRPALLGSLIGVMAALKVTPIFLILWLLVGKRRMALAWFAAASAVLLAVAALGTGPGALLEYPSIIFSTSAEGSTELSAAGLARSIGVPSELARYVPWLVLVVGAAIIVWKRRDQRVGFATASCMLVLGSPVVREYWFALLLPALVVLESPAPSDDESS